MKICYIIHCLQVAGAETIVANYLIELKHKGNNVFLVEYYHRDSVLYERLVNHGIRVYCLQPIRCESIVAKIVNVLADKLNTFTRMYDRKLNSIVSIEHPDVIHWHTTISYISRLHFDTRKMFYTIHSDFQRWLSISSERVDKVNTLLSNGMTLIVLNKKMLSDARSYFNGAKAVHIGNGLDLKAIKQKKGNREEFLRLIGLNHDAFVIAMVSRFHPIKNHEWSVDVFERILSRNPKSYLLYIGQEDNGIKERILDKMKTYNIPKENIVFMGMRNDATKILSICDACIIPSLSESFSLVAIEAQIHNVRLVTSDAIPEEVICNPNAFRLSLSSSADAWADCILGMDTTTNSNSLDEFDISLVVNKHIELYKCSLNNSSFASE